jgi:hypothetical protein
MTRDQVDDTGTNHRSASDRMLLIGELGGLISAAHAERLMRGTRDEDVT